MCREKYANIKLKMPLRAHKITNAITLEMMWPALCHGLYMLFLIKFLLDIRFHCYSNGSHTQSKCQPPIKSVPPSPPSLCTRADLPLLLLIVVGHSIGGTQMAIIAESESTEMSV